MGLSHRAAPICGTPRCLLPPHTQSWAGKLGLGKSATRWSWEPLASSPGSALCQLQAQRGHRLLSSTSSTLESADCQLLLQPQLPASTPKVPPDLGVDHNSLAPRPGWKEGGTDGDSRGQCLFSGGHTAAGWGGPVFPRQSTQQIFSHMVSDPQTKPLASTQSRVGQYLNLPRNPHWHAGKDL